MSNNLFNQETIPQKGYTVAFGNRKLANAIVHTGTSCNDVARICAVKNGNTFFGGVVQGDSLEAKAVPMYKGGKMQEHCLLSYFTATELISLLPSSITSDMGISYSFTLTTMPNGAFIAGFAAGAKWLVSAQNPDINEALAKLIVKVSELGIDLSLPEYDSSTLHPFGGANPAPAKQADANLTVSQVSAGQLRPGDAANIQTLKDTLAKFGCAVEPTVDIIYSAQVIKYLVKPRSRTKVNDIARLSDDLAISLKVKSCVIAKNENGQVTIEIPNPSPKVIMAADMVTQSLNHNINTDALGLSLGKDTDNSIVHLDLASCPHLLLAGSTGQGKSVGLNLVFYNLIKRYSPDDVRFLVIDPKRVELAHLNKCPQYLLGMKMDDKDVGHTVLYDDLYISIALRKLVAEMEKRYSIFEAHGVRSLKEFHKASTLFLPYLVCVVDELADLLMSASGRECSENLVKLAQKARAVGIHLVLATQRPDANILSGALRSNIPVRISYKTVTSKDSVIIIGQAGAQRLLGNGDALILQGGSVKRFQTAYVSDIELNMAIAAAETTSKDYFI